ncbi:MAG TPA: glycosyltransferase, partial [Prosthecobacter sp.]|nr:glycosyltransferase [Prosthecobacter sp.]
MKTPVPELSIVVPTCRRVASLGRLLTALELQEYPPERYEVIVIADGDEEAGKFLKKYAGRLRMRFAVQESAGPGVARNRGASMAQGR